MAEALVERLNALGAQMYLPGGAAAFTEGVAALQLRRIVTEQDGLLSVPPTETAAIAFYAGSVLDRLEGPAAPASQGMTDPSASIGT